MNTNQDYSNFLKSLSEAVHSSRMSAGLTQTELAERANRVQSAIAKLENSPSPHLALQVLYDISSALELPLSDLIKMAEGRSYLEKKSSNRSLQKSLEALPEKKRKWVEKIISDLVKGALTH